MDAESEHLLSRQQEEELKIWAEKLAERETQKILQQIAMEMPPMDPTLATRLLTGDSTLAATHVGPMTAQVYKCKIVKEFEVEWSGKDDEGKRYNLAPAVLPGGQQYYLKPGTKELISTARQINREERPKFAQQIAPHQFATTKTLQIVHPTPSALHNEQDAEKEAMKLNTDHVHTAHRLPGLAVHDSIQRQAQQLHEQRRLQRQVRQVTEAVDDYEVDRHNADAKLRG